MKCSNCNNRLGESYGISAAGSDRRGKYFSASDMYLFGSNTDYYGPRKKKDRKAIKLYKHALHIKLADRY